MSQHIENKTTHTQTHKRLKWDTKKGRKEENVTILVFTVLILCFYLISKYGSNCLHVFVPHFLCPTQENSQPQGQSKRTHSHLPTSFWKDWRAYNLKEWPLARHGMLAARVNAQHRNASGYSTKSTHLCSLCTRKRSWQSVPLND